MREYGFLLTCIIKKTDLQILSLYGRLRVNENPYSRTSYAVLTLSQTTVISTFMIDVAMLYTPKIKIRINLKSNSLIYFIY